MERRAYILIDPDDQSIRWLHTMLDVDRLCDLLRCDATDAIELVEGLVGYIDGEGAWQGRQQEWHWGEQIIWGPMLIFRGTDEQELPISCQIEDMEIVEELVTFWEPLENEDE